MFDSNIVKSNCNDKFFKKKLKTLGVDLQGISEHLPCSIEAVDHIGELVIHGQSKLKQELLNANEIPASERKLIDMAYLA